MVMTVFNSSTPNPSSQEEGSMQCMKCGEWLPRSKLELMKTGTRRRVCNHCKWLYYVKPSRERAILRELALRRSSGSTKA